MTIINIRGTSGSGKSTLVHRFLAEHDAQPLRAQLSNWKTEKIVAYRIPGMDDSIWQDFKPVPPLYIIGRYETQCGGCDALSYKGAHEDIEEMVREAAKKGHVIFEGLTISSTITRWQRVSDAYPGQFVWAFMDTPEEICHQRILARSGREPKRDNRGLADYQRKYRGCMQHVEQLKAKGERVELLSSDDAGYKKLLELLNG